MLEKQDQPPELEQVSPLVHFFKQDAVAAGLLLLSALAALIIANSPAAEWYTHLWHTHLAFSVGDWRLDQSLHHWINDGLMAIFFFMVGLEIKRELLVGELASVRKALLPAMAAVGGMLVPALIFYAFNAGTPAAKGWGIPMATDIAFATGCLALLGGRVPASIGVFLVALAIVDDIGSVLVIALFYTDQLALRPLLVGAILVLLSYGLSRIGVRHTYPYAIIGILVWFEFLLSGVHATIAGVLLAFTIPADARYETPLFSGRMSTLLQRFAGAEDYVNPLLVNARQQSLIRSILKECHHVEAPLQRIEHALHPLCVFFIMPVFAFANSGVSIEFSSFGSMLLEPVALGALFGLMAGKQIGVMLFSFLAVKLRWAELPKGITWPHVYGVSWLAGIGFTMALFIDELAFTSGGVDAAEMARHLAEAKVGIFLASFFSGVGGYLLLRAVCRGGSHGTGATVSH
ncbi:MAG: Na+/H+ antiporter NhaA [Candidatus Hydrogenedentes bacterium]|nr:Na+/H+ antiporter NhaA [Candidatus Hydrogenedentota bacterium]